jgi:deoxyribodipyrimidine photo-lyase
MSTSLFWFRRDLRLNDNPGLTAARASSSAVFGVFCAAELDSLNRRQRAFALGSLKHLRLVLEKRNATISMLDGVAADALVSAARRLGATTVHCARSYDREEQAVEAAAQTALQAAGIAFRAHGGGVVHEPEAVAERKQAPGAGYRVFPPFLQTWQSLEAAAPVAEAWPNGADAEPGPLAVPADRASVSAGEAVGRALLQSFVTSRAVDYAVNGAYPGRDGSSNLAAHLRFGCVSPRTVRRAVAERMAKTWTLAPERTSMSAFLRQLAMRDFFIHLAFYAPELHDDALQEKMRGFPWSRDETMLKKWTGGHTGYPLIDAAMRQLHAEGLIHQRAAINAASFYCFDLGLDWRLGRDVWMQQHVAADAALCDGNWQWIAGIGSDQAAYPRVYNPIKQARQFDAQAVYVRRWCQELRKLPSAAALAPWQIDRQRQIELGFFTPDQYPPPVVDHESVAREFLKKYRAYRER